MNFSKVAQNDARSLKIIGCIFLHFGGGGEQKPQMQNFRHFFYFSYFVSLPYFIVGRFKLYTVKIVN